MIRRTLLSLVAVAALAGAAFAGGDEPSREEPTIARAQPEAAAPAEEPAIVRLFKKVVDKKVVEPPVEETASPEEETETAEDLEIAEDAPSYDEPDHAEAEGCHPSYGY